MGISKGLKRLFSKGYIQEALASSGWLTFSGQNITTRSAMQQATVFNCVRVLSESVGMLPCKLYQSDGRNRTPALKHPLYSLLECAPNEYMTAQEFWELLMVCLCLRGNFYAYKVKALGQISELLPVSPDIVTPVLNDDWTVTYKVNFKKGERLLTQDELWHVRLPTQDGLIGLNPISHARQLLGLNQAMEQHAATLFKNGAIVSGVLETDSTLTQEAYDILKKSFEAQHSGTENAFGNLILEAGLKWKPISLNMQDTQFIEARRMNEAQICGLFRVPPHLVANLEKMTLNNIEHMSMSFVRFSLVPYLTRIEKRIKVGLLDKTERNQYSAKFNTGALLRGDSKARSEFYMRLMQTGAISPNEIRELEEMNPREGGDIYLTPLNMTADTGDTGKMLSEGNDHADKE